MVQCIFAFGIDGYAVQLAVIFSPTVYSPISPTITGFPPGGAEKLIKFINYKYAYSVFKWDSWIYHFQDRYLLKYLLIQ